MNNWQLIATLATLVIAIYGANWSAQRSLKERIETFRNEMAARLDQLLAEVKAETAETRAEFRSEIAEVKAAQGITNHRLESIEARFRPVSAD